MALHVTPGAAGVDEAGRGPLAGPVVAAAVVLPDAFCIEGLNDSKKLTAETRESLAERIRAEAHWSVCFIDAPEIDRLNILRASLEAMRRAVLGLTFQPSCVYVDGNQTVAGLTCEVYTVVKGDSLYASIAAASILAKVARDAYMCEQATIYPEYGFDQHFGYAVPFHKEAIEQHGVCPLHRRSFAPVRERLEQDQLSLVF